MTFKSALDWLTTYIHPEFEARKRIIRAIQKDAFYKGATQNGTLSVDEQHLTKIWMQFVRKNRLK